MPYELIDESRGPGVPAGSALSLQEIWAALGYDDGRVPTLDEVLIEIRELRRDEEDQVEYIPQSALSQPSVSYGAFGMTVVGYSADDVLKIREHYLASQQKVSS